MINTTKGPMDPALLECKKGCDETETEKVDWIEYYLEDELVHRSVHLTLKELPVLNTEVGE